MRDSDMSAPSITLRDHTVTGSLPGPSSLKAAARPRLVRVALARGRPRNCRGLLL